MYEIKLTLNNCLFVNLKSKFNRSYILIEVNFESIKSGEMKYMISRYEKELIIICL